MGFFNMEFFKIQSEFSYQSGSVMAPQMVWHDDIIGSAFIEEEGFVNLVGKDDNYAVGIDFFDLIDQNQVGVGVFDSANDQFGLSEVEFF